MRAGIYDAPLLEPGQYSIEFSKEGFEKLVRNGVSLHTEAITVDAALKVGSLSDTVTVTADVPLVQTETSERSTVLTEKTVNDLPNVGRDWADLTGQLPGVNPGGNGNGGGQDASGQGVGVNGSAGFEVNFLTDGGVTTLPVSQNRGVMVPLDDIAEVDMSTSNFSAESGNGVAVFNVITKSGGNQFHGSLYEFVQNDKLEARNYFAPSVTPLRWNMYGGTFGGPIRRNKAFFFFSYQGNPNINYAPTFYTFPTPAMKGVGTPNGNANFSALLGAPGVDANGNPIINPCNNQQEIYGQIYDPSTTRTVNGQPCRLPFPGNIIPANRIDPVAAKIQAYFPNPNLPGLGNNYYFAGRSPSSSNAYSGKLDYNFSASNHLSGSVQVNPGSSFSPAPTCPVGSSAVSGCQNSTGTLSQVQITDDWTFSPKLINEARISFLRQYGVWSTPDQGQEFPQKIGLPNLPANAFPNINVGGFLPINLGGGLHAKLGFNSFMYSDSVTWSTGKHTWKFGGEFNRWQDNQAWQDVDAGDYSFSGNFTLNPSDLSNPNIPSPQVVGYADFLLGQVDNWSVSMSPEYGARTWNLQTFAQDDYKITPHLTLNLGVRYALQTGWTEVANRFANFDPSLLNPGTGTLGALCFAGQTFSGHHCPRAQEKTIADIFDPRVGFAWSPKNNWSIRGAYGIFSTMWGANNYVTTFLPGWSIQGSLPTISVLQPVFTLSNGPPAGSIVYPSAAERTPSSLNGQGVTYQPYDTPAAYLQQWHFDIQHQILGRVGVEAAYVGSRGVHLPFPRDINQVPQALLGPNDSPQFRPYPQYPGGIGANLYDGISNYHSFQFTARTAVSHGLSFRFNYTFSKTLDETTTSGWCCTSDNYQNSYDPRANYGPAAFDIPQLLNGSVVYELPFGSGKPLLNQGGLLNKVVGGWQLSSVFQVHSGIPFTPVVSNNLTFSYAGTEYPNRLGSGTLPNPSINDWFDLAAFAVPPPYTFGDSGRHILRGPNFRNMNLSLAKNIKITKLGEGGALQMRVDAYNTLNHPNFGQPDPNIDQSTAGTITNTANGNRSLQIGARLSF